MEGISGKSASTGASLCEILNGRTSQQDAMFFGTLGDGEAIDNPKEFYKKTLRSAVEEHQECENGTTICSAIVKPNKGGLPTITTANLGDSRASLIVKYNTATKGQEANYQYKSVSLTEDHSLDVPRCSQAIRDAGGKITECIEVTIGDDMQVIDLRDNEYGLKSRNLYSGGDEDLIEDVNNKLNKRGLKLNIRPRSVRVDDNLKLAAAIGDSITPSVMKAPDIWEHDLSRIYRDLSIDPNQVEDVDLIVACDGLWDATHDANRYTSTDGNDRKFSNNGSYPNSLAHKKCNYDAHQTNTKSRFFGQSFAQFATYTSVSDENKDNISVIHVPLITAQKIKVVDAPIIATVCDGHGDSTSTSLDDHKFRQDGALVSASVAAQLYVAANVQQIADMVKKEEGHPKDYLAEFIAREV